MYTEKMNDKEILQQFYADKKYLRARAYHHLVIMRRRLLKENHFPCTLTHRVRKANGNTYVINMWVDSAQSLIHGRATLHHSILVDSNSGYMVMKPYHRYGNGLVLRFPAHFIKCYRERMKKEGTFDQMITNFTKGSILLQFRSTGKGEDGKEAIQGGSLSGAYFGETNEFGGITFKTFIPKDLLNDRQMKVHKQNVDDFYKSLAEIVKS